MSSPSSFASPLSPQQPSGHANFLSYSPLLSSSPTSAYPAHTPNHLSEPVSSFGSGEPLFPSAFALSSCHKYLFSTGSWDCAVHITPIDASSSSLKRTPPLRFGAGHHNSPTSAIAVTPDGSLAVTGAVDGSLLVWQLQLTVGATQSKLLIPYMIRESHPALTATGNPPTMARHSAAAAAVSTLSTIMSLPSTSAALGFDNSTASTAQGVAIQSESGSAIAGGAIDTSAIVSHSPAVLGGIPGAGTGAGAGFSASSLSFSADNAAQQLTQMGVSPILRLTPHDGAVTALSASAEIDLIASGSRDGTVILHSLRTGTYIDTLHAEWPSISGTTHENETTITSPSLGPQPPILATSSSGSRPSSPTFSMSGEEAKSTISPPPQPLLTPKGVKVSMLHLPPPVVDCVTWTAVCANGVILACYTITVESIPNDLMSMLPGVPLQDEYAQVIQMSVQGIKPGQTLTLRQGASSSTTNMGTSTSKSTRRSDGGVVPSRSPSPFCSLLCSYSGGALVSSVLIRDRPSSFFISPDLSLLVTGSISGILTVRNLPSLAIRDVGDSHLTIDSMKRVSSSAITSITATPCLRYLTVGTAAGEIIVSHVPQSALGGSAAGANRKVVIPDADMFLVM